MIIFENDGSFFKLSQSYRFSGDLITGQTPREFNRPKTADGTVLFSIGLSAVISTLTRDGDDGPMGIPIECVGLDGCTSPGFGMIKCSLERRHTVHGEDRQTVRQESGRYSTATFSGSSFKHF